MFCRRSLVVCVLTALSYAAFCPWPATAQMSGGVSVPPQQMTPYQAPAAYPSTYPSYPATAGTYPSTTGSGSLSPALPPYDSLPLTAATPGNAGGDSPRTATSGNGILNAPTDSRPLYAPYGSPDAMTAARSPDRFAYIERSLLSDEPWSWQLLPPGLMYKSYLAGNKEPRMGSQWFHERTLGWRWDATLGGRVGLLRYGTENDFWPQGWQLDVEGAAFPRVDLDHQRDLDTVDFRAGAPLTTRQGPWEFKFGYYHLSSHLGDEFVLKNPGVPRINYVRESLASGLAVYLDPCNPNMRLYAEVGWAFYTDGGAKPWEFQFGIDMSPAAPTSGWGAPFFAINGHLRQENDFGGNMTVQTGWQWRGRTGHLFRLGMQYFNGMSDQYQFFNRFEEQIGMGMWYDY